VIGRNAAVGAEAMQRTLGIMTHEEFELLNITDDIIENVIVRSAIVRKVGKDRLTRFVLAHLRPVMTKTELLMLDIAVELVIEDTEA
jgi:hypothetical protein